MKHAKKHGPSTAQHEIISGQVWAEAKAHGRARARPIYAGTKRPVTRHEKAYYTLWQPPARANHNQPSPPCHLPANLTATAHNPF
jgi:hypothetical protein